MLLVLVLMIAMCNPCWATGITTEGMKVFTAYWQNKNEKCMQMPAEELKFCVAKKRRDISAVSQIFKSICCQCHVVPTKGGELTPTRGNQVFRQCLLSTNNNEGNYRILWCVN